MVGNGWVYGSLAITKHFRVQLQIKFNKKTKVSHTTYPPMNYIPCYLLAITPYSLDNLNFTYQSLGIAGWI